MMKLRLGSQVVSLRGIIFDKDGTLLNSFVIWPRLIRRRVEYLEGYFTLEPEVKELIMRAMGLGKDNIVVRRSPIVVGTRYQTAGAVATVLFLHQGIPWDEGLQKTLAAFATCDEQAGLDWQAVPIPGVADALRRLHGAGFRLAVATNDDRKRTEALMDLCGLKPYIHAYACQDEVGNSKPDPEMVYLAARRLGLSPSECAVVGDSLLDVEMGRRAGVKVTVGVTSGACSASELEGVADVVLPGVVAMLPDGEAVGEGAC
ncbi:MAG TPA: hypothetical protein DEA73_05275 [Peptococcaceae bacterium]|nr:hypothetical protein [Peptococcaceae bacterium]